MYQEITDILNEGVQKEHFPGAQYCVVKKDGTIFCDFVGYKQTYPHKIKCDGTEIYDCASLTKVISTTTMIFKLIEDKKISLDTKISDILEQFKHKEIKVFHLLTHSSGLPADIPRAKTLKTPEDVKTKIFEFDLINPIGEKVIYSDIGFMLLGFVIEKITKLSLNDYATKVIFKPLGMTDTSYQPNKERCAPTEYRDDDVFKGLLQGRVHDEKAFALNGMAGHAGMFSTAKDLAKFILAILQDNFVLSKETVDSLFPVQIEDTSKLGNKLIRSLGWNKPTKNSTSGDNTSLENTILHTGFTGCNVFIEKEKGIGFVLLSNAVHPQRELNGIRHYRNRIGNVVIPTKETM